MANPRDLRYSKEHEWTRVEGNIAVVGITDYAQQELGDVVYVDLPAVGTRVQQFKKFGEIESVKAVSELFSPVGGEVVERNEALFDQPELVNQSAYRDGWMIKVRMSDPHELNNLLTAEQYEELTGEAE